MGDFDQLHEALTRLRHALPRAVELLGAGTRTELASWAGLLDARIIPRLAPDYPLVVAICGGGSTGKSTLFNSLLGEHLAPVAGRAGLSRRVLAAAHPALAARERFLENLFEPFGALAQPLRYEQELTLPGCPLYVEHPTVPPNVILLDTPDFDTGFRGEYINRHLAKPVLEACDVLVYIFTNATYNNRDNTAFMADILTGIGRRRCILVYRCYASYTKDEVQEHALTVAQNLYGAERDQYLLGVYRADDTNEVAAGGKFLSLRPLHDTGAGLRDALRRLDPRAIREQVNRSILEDVLKKARAMLADSRLSLTELSLYRDMIRLAQSHCVSQAVQHFPAHEAVGRLKELWYEASPAPVRLLRRAGRTVSAPMRYVYRLFGGKGGPAPADPMKDVEEDAARAANELRHRVIADALFAQTTEQDPDGLAMKRKVGELRAGRSIEEGGRPYLESGTEPGAFSIHLEAPAVAAAVREQIRKLAWEAELGRITDAVRKLGLLPAGFDDELRELVRDFRARMKLSERMRELWFASLEMIPPTIALAYVLTTADPVGGTGVFAKIHGLFGLHDLVAVVALPASTGLNEVSLRKFEELLKPIVERWVSAKAVQVEAIFRERITGPVFAEADRILGDAQALLDTAEESLRICEHAGQIATDRDPAKPDRTDPQPVSRE